MDCQNITDPFTFKFLLGSGYWPGGVKVINYVINEEVFILWDAFKSRMPGSSERAFIMALTDISNNNGRVCLLIIIYVTFHRKMSTLQNV